MLIKANGPESNFKYQITSIDFEKQLNKEKTNMIFWFLYTYMFFFFLADYKYPIFCK